LFFIIKINHFIIFILLSIQFEELNQKKIS